jgi:hypothetical protein
MSIFFFERLEKQIIHGTQNPGRTLRADGRQFNADSHAVPCDAGPLYHRANDLLHEGTLSLPVPRSPASLSHCIHSCKRTRAFRQTQQRVVSSPNNTDCNVTVAALHRLPFTLHRILLSIGASGALASPSRRRHCQLLQHGARCVQQTHNDASSALQRRRWRCHYCRRSLNARYIHHILSLSISS